LVIALLLVVGAGWAGAGSAHAAPLLPQCSDNVDNDGDGERDFPDDPGCGSYDDADESVPSNVSQCADRIDNDNDGAIDFPEEPGCASGADTDERNPANRPDCSDGRDNDNDGVTDYPADPGCGWAGQNNTERTTGECSDGIDNDGDGRTDWRGNDFGCARQNDTSEIDDPQCNDGRDNDGDGRLDTADSDCSDANDALEGPTPVCSDGRDNDGDGKIDFPADPGCSFAGDGDETDTVIYSLPTGPGTNTSTGSGPSGTQTASRAPLLSPFPIVRLRGRVDRRGTRITLLTIRAPNRAKVSVYCSGKSCPRKRFAINVVNKLVRVKQFEKRLRGGTTLKVYVTRPGFIGKYTRFRFINRRVPLRSDRCAIKAGTKPRSCPSSS
jgi:hypothetical protein